MRRVRGDAVCRRAGRPEPVAGGFAGGPRALPSGASWRSKAWVKKLTAVDGAACVGIEIELHTTGGEATRLEFVLAPDGAAERGETDPAGPRPVQLRYQTGLTGEAYVRAEAWRDARLERCPNHVNGGCSLARHGT